MQEKLIISQDIINNKGRTINYLGGPGQKRGKKTSKVQRLVADEKKSSTRILCPGPPPRSLMVRPLHNTCKHFHENISL